MAAVLIMLLALVMFWNGDFGDIHHVVNHSIATLKLFGEMSVIRHQDQW